MEHFDYLLVGAGLFNATIANELIKAGKSVLVVEKRPTLGGNLYCEDIEGIKVHKYGPHIFHTSNKKVWEYVNNITEFGRFTNAPLANYKGELYHLPFNMNTFNKLWGVNTPAEAKEKIESEIVKCDNPTNIEDKALSLVGRDIYEKLIKGYTSKQWGMAPGDLPAFIIGRLPLRFNYDNDYFNDTYEGIPIAGYNELIDKMIKGAEILLNTDYLKEREQLDKLAQNVIYSGPIDAFFNYEYGKLEYRSLKFEEERLGIESFQGNAVVNYTDIETPFTRIIEHKFFETGDKSIFTKPYTIITREYPAPYIEGKEAYYPINNEQNDGLYAKYKEKVKELNRDKKSGEPHIYMGGRLGAYKYMNMDLVIESAFKLLEEIKLA